MLLGRWGPASKAPMSIEDIFTVEAPGVLLNDAFHLSSFGPSLAVALADQLYLWLDDNAGFFTGTENGKSIFCVQRSLQNKKGAANGSANKRNTGRNTALNRQLLAVGLETLVEVWSIEKECVCLNS